MVMICVTNVSVAVFCGKCGNPLGHEFVGDGPDKGSRYIQGCGFTRIADPGGL